MSNHGRSFFFGGGGIANQDQEAALMKGKLRDSEDTLLWYKPITTTTMAATTVNPKP